MGSGGSSAKRIEPVLITTTAVENNQGTVKDPPEHFIGLLLNSHDNYYYKNNYDEIFKHFIFFIFLIFILLILYFLYSKSTT
jgi:hypothetical protein